MLILQRSLPDESKPIIIPKRIQLGLRPQAPTSHTTNGHVAPIPNGTIGKRKRTPEDEGNENTHTPKRGRLAVPDTSSELVVLDDPGNGVILIDED